MHTAAILLTAMQSPRFGPRLQVYAIRLNLVVLQVWGPTELNATRPRERHAATPRGHAKRVEHVGFAREAKKPLPTDSWIPASSISDQISVQFTEGLHRQGRKDAGSYRVPVAPRFPGDQAPTNLWPG